MILTDYCKDLTLSSNHPVDFNQSASLGVETWSVPAHRFELDWSSTPIFSNVEQRKLFAYLDNLKKGQVTFNWLLPIHSEPNGLANANPFLFQSASAGQTSVVIEKSDEVYSFLSMGDLIKFSNHTKVYMVTNEVAGENPTVELNAPLKVGLSVSDSMITRNVEMTVRADPDFDGASYSRKAGDLHTSFTARFLEVV